LPLRLPEERGQVCISVLRGRASRSGRLPKLSEFGKRLIVVAASAWRDGRHPMNRPTSPWVIVLAGGDGRRLDGAMVHGRRLDRPKQFCCLGGSGTLLRDTLRRAERITDQSRIVAVVRAEHRRWWIDELAQLPSRNVLAEPENHGTAVAILHAVVHVLQHEGDPTLVILPSDHAADEEDVLVEAIKHAARIAVETPGRFILLGLTPEYPDSDYGWILPDRDATGVAQPVSRFVEKPTSRVAAGLLSAGALWNSFICATSAQALLRLFGTSQPLVLRRLLESGALQANDESERRARFQALPCLDFGRDVLEHATVGLHVLAIPPCGWTDLGTPRRLDRWLQRRRTPFVQAMTDAIAAGST
jgi:mannose-1-phosphate guanylyltransferase